MLSSSRTTPNHFEIIYQAAKLKQKQPIEAVLKEVTIDVDSGRNGSPVSLLASEGNVEAVEFLQTQFGADKRMIIYGYARSKKLAEAQVLLAQAIIYEEWFDLLTYLVKGLASEGHTDAINEIFTPLSKYQRERLSQYVISGYMLSTNPNAADQWIAAHGEDVYQQSNLLAKIAGLAQMGKVDDVNIIIESEFKRVVQVLMPLDTIADDLKVNASHPQIQNAGSFCAGYNSYAEHLVYNLARTGRFTQALNEYCLKEKDQLRSSTLQCWAIEGAGRGGYYHEALLYIQTIKDTKRYFTFKLLDGLARGGAFLAVNQVTSLIANETHSFELTQKEIVAKFTNAGYLSHAIDFINQVNDKAQWLELMRHLFFRLDARTNVFNPTYKTTVVGLVKSYLTKAPSAERLPGAFMSLVSVGIIESSSQPGSSPQSFYANSGSGNVVTTVVPRATRLTRAPKL